MRKQLLTFQQTFHLALALLVFAPNKVSLAWTTLPEMEVDAAWRMTNETVFLDGAFRETLLQTATSTNMEMQSSALILLAIQDYMLFNSTVLASELDHASNAVVSISAQPEKWQYWMGRLVYAGAYLSFENYQSAFNVLTNAAQEIEMSGYISNSNVLERAILRKYELDELSMQQALKTLSGAGRIGF